MGTISRLTGLAAVLTTAGCVQPQWQPPPVSLLGPPVPYNAPRPPPPVILTRPLPERLALPPATLPPFEEPSYAAPEEPTYAAPTEPPFSDGTPFSLEAPTYAEPSAPSPAVETPPAVRAAEPTPAVPMVGFRPMRRPGSRSY